MGRVLPAAAARRGRVSARRIHLRRGRRGAAGHEVGAGRRNALPALLRQRPRAGPESALPARDHSVRHRGSEGAEEDRVGGTGRGPALAVFLSAPCRSKNYRSLERPRRPRPARGGTASGDGADRLRLRCPAAGDAGVRVVARAAGDDGQLGRSRPGPWRLDPERPSRLRPHRPCAVPGRRRAPRGRAAAEGHHHRGRRHRRPGLQRRRPAGGAGQSERAARPGRRRRTAACTSPTPARTACAG